MFLSETQDNFKRTKKARRTSISGDLATGMELIAEGIASWHNLRESMIRLEHTAIVNEDEKLMEQGVKGFFQKAIQWFKERWEQFRQWLTRLIQNLTERFRSVESFIKKNEKALLEVTQEQIKDTKFLGYAYKDENVNRFLGGPLVNINDMEKAAKKAQKKTIEGVQMQVARDILKMQFRSGEFVSSIKERLRGAKNQSQVQLTTEMIGKFVNNLKGSTRAIGILRANGNQIKTATDRGIAEAERAVGASDRDNEKAKQEVEAWQLTSQVLQQVNSAQVELVTEYQSVGLRALRAALVAARRGGQQSESGPVRNRRSRSSRKKKNILDHFSV